MIEQAKQRAYQAVNTELINLYWQIGQFISRKIAAAEWGEGVVEKLADYIRRRDPNLRGFTRRNLFGCGNSTRLMPRTRKCQHC